MSDFGIKIAQPTKDAHSSLSTDLVFSSLFGALPVEKILTFEYSLSAFQSTRRYIAHGMPFVPFYMIFWKGSTNSDRYIWYPTSGAAILTSNDQQVGNDRVDMQNISFTTLSNNSGTTIIKVIIVVFNFPIALSM